MSNIILIGFMGVGKTSVGKKLSAELKMNYVDTDELIEKEAGKSISLIFSEKGEKYFRELESKAIDQISHYDNYVISTGGGIVLRPENVERLKKIGPLVLLSASTKVIFERLKGFKNRPLLDVPNPEEMVDEILESRNPTYNQVADLKVDTSIMNIEEVANKIIEFIRGKK